MRGFVTLWLFAAAVLLSACGTVRGPIPAAPYIVAFDSRGEIRDPQNELETCRRQQDETTAEHEARCAPIFDPLFAALKDYAAKQDAEGKPRKIMIFVHGGLNSTASSIGRANLRAKAILADGIFPIFVVWRSSLPSSYWEHVAHLRQGRYFPWRASWRRVPFIPLEDLGNGIIRTPAAWSSELSNKFHQMNNTYGQDVDEVSESVAAAYDHCIPSLALSQGKGEPDTRPGRVASRLVYPLTVPTKILTAPVLAGFGSGAWRALLHRTSVLFHTDRELEFRSNVPLAEKAPYEFQSSSGGLAQFYRRLKTRLAGEQWEITMIGHSMGAIVVNQSIREFGDDLPIRNIVYLASAATLSDYQTTVFPYLQRKNTQRSKNPWPVHMYHLTLHREAEVTERWTGGGFGVVDWPLRGSLLMWIDSFLAQPSTRYEHTSGRYTNLLRVLHDTPRDIWQNVHIKAFSLDAQSDPYKHGGFGDKPFWREEFWKPSVTVRQCEETKPAS